MNTKAFTLIELMIVVAIVAFLAAVSVPHYVKYLAKARQAEVMVNLAAIHTAQQTYHAQNGCYTTTLWGSDGVGWRPEGYKGGGKQENFYYTYGFNFPGAQEGVHYFTGKLGALVVELGETKAEEGTFIAKAAGNVSGKEKADVWQIDEGRAIKNVQNGID
jgi:prepilin-type N-terminal cleavage/methylation domain-containing protein